MDFTKFDDGFFCIDRYHGFLPKVDPLESLPMQFSGLQTLLDNIPLYVNIKDMNGLDVAVNNLPNYLDEIKQIDDNNILLFQGLFRGYAMLTSAYLLMPSHINQVDGLYGKAKQILPSNIVQPFEYVADRLKVFPFLDYHFAYSSGNYVKRNTQLSENEAYRYDNLRLAVSFSGTKDEEGFIMLHVDIVSKTKKLIQGIEQFLNGDKLVGLNTVLEASKEINERRKQMWTASDYRKYNSFRAFIMGIKGNNQIFGEGVTYEGSTNVNKRTYRGQTGAQDDTIPTLDIFTGVTRYYPENELTKYLLDLRQYRPVVFQEFFKELEQHGIKYEELDLECLKILYLILNEIWAFRNGHWQFVQKYILENTKYATATGGTPITTWIPNQIGAVLDYMTSVLDKIKELSPDDDFLLNGITLNEKKNILVKQQQELMKKNYDATSVFETGEKFNDVKIIKGESVCPFHH
jgi:indoleamine 2,3-dioxygenase